MILWSWPPFPCCGVWSLWRRGGVLYVSEACAVDLSSHSQFWQLVMPSSCDGGNDCPHLTQHALQQQQIAPKGAPCNRSGVCSQPRLAAVCVRWQHLHAVLRALLLQAWGVHVSPSSRQRRPQAPRHSAAGNSPRTSGFWALARPPTSHIATSVVSHPVSCRRSRWRAQSSGKPCRQPPRPSKHQVSLCCVPVSPLVWQLSRVVRYQCVCVCCGACPLSKKMSPRRPRLRKQMWPLPAPHRPRHHLTQPCER